MTTVELEIKGILGVSKVIRQGGSLRLSIPHKAVMRHNLERQAAGDGLWYILVDTDKGFFLIPVTDALTENVFRHALEFIDTSHLSKEEILTLLEEHENTEAQLS